MLQWRSGWKNARVKRLFLFISEVTRWVEVRFEKRATDRLSSDESAPKPPSRRSVEEVRLEKCGCETTLSFYFEVTRSVQVRFEKSATDQQSSDESAPKPPSRRSVEEVRLEKCACETTLSF